MHCKWVFSVNCQPKILLGLKLTGDTDIALSIALSRAVARDL